MSNPGQMRWRFLFGLLLFMFGLLGTLAQAEPREDRAMVSITNVGGGDAQTYATVRIMAREANHALFDVAVVNAAVNIVRHVPGRDTDALAATLRAWLEDHIEFLPDPLLDGDLIRSPRFVLNEIARHGSARADCDDCATLAAALSKAIGLRARFVVLGFEHPRAPFAHVYTEVLTASGWRELDVTESDAQRAAMRNHITRAITYPV